MPGVSLDSLSELKKIYWVMSLDDLIMIATWFVMVTSLKINARWPVCNWQLMQQLPYFAFTVYTNTTTCFLWLPLHSTWHIFFSQTTWYWKRCKVIRCFEVYQNSAATLPSYI